MARIRSVHPGQWTDEAFVSVSFPARLLAIALRNEADDNGVFEWKPRVLKMRLFPADAVDVDDLLAEMSDNDLVRRFDVDGRPYGAIRNFRKWQRPEKPKGIHPLPEAWRAYVGLSANEVPPGGDHSPNGGGQDGDASPNGVNKTPPQSPTAPRPVADQSPTAPRNVEQRKEEGGDREEEGGIDSSSNDISVAPGATVHPRAIDAEAEALIEAADTAIATQFAGRRRRRHGADLAIARGWAERRIGPERIAAIVSASVERYAASRPGDMPVSLRLFESDVDKAEPRSPYPPGIVSDDDRQWFDRVVAWKVKGVWIARHGPKPDEPGTAVPDHVLAGHGMTRRKVRAA